VEAGRGSTSSTQGSGDHSTTTATRIFTTKCTAGSADHGGQEWRLNASASTIASLSYLQGVATTTTLHDAAKLQPAAQSTW